MLLLSAVGRHQPTPPQHHRVEGSLSKKRISKNLKHLKTFTALKRGRAGGKIRPKPTNLPLPSVSLRRAGEALTFKRVVLANRRQSEMTRSNFWLQMRIRADAAGRVVLETQRGVSKKADQWQINSVAPPPRRCLYTCGGSQPGSRKRSANLSSSQSYHALEAREVKQTSQF